MAWAQAPSTAPLGVNVAEVMTDLRKAWGVLVTSVPGDLLEMTRKAAASLVSPGAATAARASSSGGSLGRIRLAGMTGRNRTERLISWSRANDPTGAARSWEQITKRAAELARQPNVTIEDANARWSP